MSKYRPFAKVLTDKKFLVEMFRAAAPLIRCFACIYYVDQIIKYSSGTLKKKYFKISNNDNENYKIPK